MKSKTTFLIAAFVLTISASAQNRKALLSELQNHARNEVVNRSYDVDRSKLYEGVLVMMKQEYSKLTVQDPVTGIIEGYHETDRVKETFRAEIVGSGPYRVVYSLRQQYRNLELSGRYTGWFENTIIPDNYTYKVSFEVYVAVYNGFSWPDNLVEKVNKFNDGQKRDKNKLLPGRDF